MPYLYGLLHHDDIGFGARQCVGVQMGPKVAGLSWSLFLIGQLTYI